MALKLPSLKYRRTRGDLIETFKLLQGETNLNLKDFFQLRPNSSTTRNPEFKIFKEYAKTRTRCNFFSNRIINIWNSLSMETKLSKDILTFKKNIDWELKDIMYDFD